MAKTVRFYCVENGEDLYVLADYEARALGKKDADIETELGHKGAWRSMTLRPATAGLERQIAARALVRDELVGTRQEPLLLPGARFAAAVATWWGQPAPETSPDGTVGEPAAPTAADFEALPPNLADRVDYAIRKHLRPQATDDPDFFTRSSEASP